MMQLKHMLVDLSSGHTDAQIMDPEQIQQACMVQDLSVMQQMTISRSNAVGCDNIQCK